MKHTFDEHQIDLAAKNLINRFELEHKEEVQPQAEKTYFTDIKVAKAKAGARRHINRTVRICAVAAVLMVGIVCALFMGAKEDDKSMEIYIEKQGYMWKNNDPEAAENMPVMVTIDFKEYDKNTLATLPNSDKNMSISEAEQKYGWKWNGTEWETGVKLKGDIVIKDITGKIVKEFYDISYTYMYDNKWVMTHTEYVGKATELKAIWYMQIMFSDDFSDCEIFISDDFGRSIEDFGVETLDTGPNYIVGTWKHQDAIFITSGVSDREQAIQKRYENAERYLTVINSSHIKDRIKNHAWN